jgi:hypothetical protein
VRSLSPRSSRAGQILTAVGLIPVVVALGALSWWCWQRGVVETVRDGVPLTRIEGVWWTAATGAATLGGILLLGAVRAAVLALRAGPRRDRDVGITRVRP